MEKENFFIGSQYEVHKERDYIVVKDTEQISYLKISGNIKDRILHNLKDAETIILLNTLFSKQSRAEGKKLICIKNPYQKRRLRFFSNCLDALCKISSIIFVIMVGFLIGILSIKYQVIENRHFYIKEVLWVIINILVHEAGHIFLCEYSGRVVHSYGIKMNYGMPMFYVDTTDICMAGINDRVKTSLGGVYFNSFLCIVSGLFGLFFKSAYLLECSRISFFFMGSNLIPFWRLDGYYILSDCLEINNLNKESKRMFKEFPLKSRDRKNFFLVIYFTSRKIFFLIVILRFTEQIMSYVSTIF